MPYSSPSSRHASSSSSQGPLPHSLKLKVFAATAVVMLLGMSALVEVSIRQHRTQMFEALARDGIRVVTRESEPFLAIHSGDEASFRRHAEAWLESSQFVFFRVQSELIETPWLIAREGLPIDSAGFREPDTNESVIRLVRRGGLRVLEIAMPTGSLARALDAESSQESPAEAGSLWIGLDVTRAHADSIATARRIHLAQAGISVVVLLALWLSIGWVLRRPKLPSRDANPRPLSGRDDILPTVQSPAIDPSRIDYTEPSSANAEDVDLAYDAIQSRDRPTPAPKADHAYRILLVEDNPVNRTVAVRMLESLGCVVECAEDGEESLLHFERERFDLIFMDIQMPRMDGLRATQLMRAAEVESGVDPTPIVALTAHSQPEDRRAYVRSGMDGHISKPFTAEDLERTLIELCAGTKSGAVER